MIQSQKMGIHPIIIDSIDRMLDNKMRANEIITQLQLSNVPINVIPTDTQIRNRKSSRKRRFQREIRELFNGNEDLLMDIAQM